MNTGTPRELKPIAEQVLAWVAFQRNHGDLEMLFQEDALRRIELCALVTMNVASFADLYDLQIRELSLENGEVAKVAEERMLDDNLEEPRRSFD